MKILLSISYDGSNYFGWQRQTDKSSVQQEIEMALSKIYNKDIKILGASRTDAKVHALDQKASFVLEHTNIPPDKIYILLNKNLPDDIVIKSSEVVNDNFNPLVNVDRKTYTYTLQNGDHLNPLFRNYATYIKDALDVKKMDKASRHFIGTYDFVAFCKHAKDKENTVRTIYDAKVHKDKDFIYFEITGSGFLHNMVRTIMGVLIDVGIGKTEVDFVKDIILSKDRNLSSKVISGNGLCLTNICLKD